MIPYTSNLVCICTITLVALMQSFSSRAAPAISETSKTKSIELAPKIKNISNGYVETMNTQETGHLQSPMVYLNGNSGYGHDSGKNTHAKQVSDWSLYDQGNHGLHDKFGDKNWNNQGHSTYSNHGKHDSYGNNYNSQGAGQASGYYSRDRGYGYEKHYGYDKEVASKQQADSHNSYGSNHGLRDHYGSYGSQANSHHGHNKHGQLSRYGNHGYGKRGNSMAVHYDYGHKHNKGHYSQPSAYHHGPIHRAHGSTYSDYSQQVEVYPSSYPNYY